MSILRTFKVLRNLVLQEGKERVRNRKKRFKNWPLKLGTKSKGEPNGLQKESITKSSRWVFDQEFSN